MPTYSYKCEQCEHRYDAFQSMKDDPHTECPQCGGQVQRLIGGGSGIVFKGSGFYVTDYRKDSGKSEGQPKSSETSGATSGSDSKPAGQSSGASTGGTKKSDSQ